MPTITQFIITLNQRVYDYIENPKAAATLNNTRDLADLQRIKGALRGMPRPHLVLICRQSHVSDLFGAMTMVPDQMKGFYQVWEGVYSNQHLDRGVVARRMAEMPPGTYFVFPNPVAQRLGFSAELLGPGVHPKEFVAADLEDGIETVQYPNLQGQQGSDAALLAREATEFHAHASATRVKPKLESRRIRTKPIAPPKMKPVEKEQRSSKTWLWILLAYLAGAATSAIVLKTSF